METERETEKGNLTLSIISLLFFRFSVFLDNFFVFVVVVRIVCS